MTTYLKTLLRWKKKVAEGREVLTVKRKKGKLSKNCQTT